MALIPPVLPEVYAWKYGILTIPDAKTYNVGSEIRDLDETVESVKCKEFKAKEAQALKNFERDTREYDATLSKLKSEAKQAEDDIKSPTIQKIITIILIAATILTLIAVVATTIMTGTLPILFAAVPLICVTAPGIYYILIFSSEISKLNKIIDAPKNLAKPVKEVIYYDKKLDYEYKKSRVRIVKMLARENLAKIAEWSIPLLVNYRLLENSKADKDSLEVFYNKSLFLVHEASIVQNKVKQEINLLDEEKARILKDIETWNSASSKKSMTPDELKQRVANWHQNAIISVYRGSTETLAVLNNQFNTLRAQINTI